MLKTDPQVIANLPKHQTTEAGKAFLGSKTLKDFRFHADRIYHDSNAEAEVPATDHQAEYQIT